MRLQAPTASRKCRTFDIDFPVVRTEGGLVDVPSIDNQNFSDE